MFKKLIQEIQIGRTIKNDSYHKETKQLDRIEIEKTPLRSDVINFLIKSLNRKSLYLEIGVRNPKLNFDLIIADEKYSVDPGIEFEENPVDFKVTSDEFFNGLENGKFLNSSLKFDVIFIDGLHISEQVERDIKNALKFIKDDGFIILHDCNPPTEWHARENHLYRLSPAGNNWNGTTWKAFVKYRELMPFNTCCVDTDWGIGIISKTHTFNQHNINPNPFFEFSVFQKERQRSLGLISFEEFMLNLKTDYRT